MIVIDKIKGWWGIPRTPTPEEIDEALAGFEEPIHICTAEDIIAEIIGRGINWYKYQDLDKQKQSEYYGNAQDILNNPVFQNEFNHYVADLIQVIAKESKNWNEVEGLRMSINGVEVLRQRLQDIQEPHDKEASKEDLNSAI